MRTTTGRNDRQRRRITAAGRLVSAALALVVATAVPAGAHGAEGELEVGEPEVGAGLEVTVPLRLTYAGDGHAVEPDEVGEITVEATQGDQQVPGEVVPDDDAPGVYTARVVLASEGTWEVTVTATEPSATATVTVDAAEAASESEETTTTEAAPPTTAEAVDVEPESADEGAGEIVDRDDDGSSSTPLIVAMVVCLVVAVGAYVLIRRARARGDA